ncbi:hypothetical protein A5712_12745 [Mycobacterium sp. E2327]|uniref:cupin domain-containing protein n=1 Tax=Mycobacterium sp. E2327 TaxID=1834132 RepID=UPI0007FD5158|nr:cupin domain-containing protein [Mycobacterium sp. E2327]OBI22392.1 hypothetical protein A5712_12745 [Mycobacterium sp. E2327]
MNNVTSADRNVSAVLAQVAHTPPGPTLDVFGATLEFLSWTDEFCVMRGVVPPEGVVPLHRHADAEDFFILSGQQEVLVSEGSRLVWRTARTGDYVRVPGGIWHAHRNLTDRPAVDLIVTTARLGRFFTEIGRPLTDSLKPPTAEDLAHFAATSSKYGYELGTPEQNAAYGIAVPGFPGESG